MPRKKDEAKRQELLRQVRDYLARHGAADVSLRPLARVLGTSDRMLLYYFGTKEKMIIEALALEDIRPLPTFQARLAEPGVPRDAAELKHLLEEAWDAFTGPIMRPLLPVYLEMTFVLPHQGRGSSLLGGILGTWTQLLTMALRTLGLPQQHAATQSTAVVGALFGLLWRLTLEDDERRIHAAFVALLDHFESDWGSHSSALAQ